MNWGLTLRLAHKGHLNQLFIFYYFWLSFSHILLCSSYPTPHLSSTPSWLTRQPPSHYRKKKKHTHARTLCVMYLYIRVLFWKHAINDDNWGEWPGWWWAAMRTGKGGWVHQASCFSSFVNIHISPHVFDVILYVNSKILYFLKKSHKYRKFLTNLLSKLT